MYTFFNGIDKEKIVFGGFVINQNEYKSNIKKLYELLININSKLYSICFDFISSKSLNELIEIKKNYESILNKKLIINKDSFYHYNQINFLLNIINKVLEMKKENIKNKYIIQMESNYRKIASYEAKKLMILNFTKEEIKCCIPNPNITINDYINRIYNRINYILFSSPKKNETYNEYKNRLMNYLENKRDFYQNAYKNFTLEERIYEYHKLEQKINGNFTDENIKKINHFKKLIFVKKLINIENKYIEEILQKLKSKYFLNNNKYNFKKIKIKELELIT